jgi:16S rRNA (cytidine1402-2'-O)-methyltransferase
VARELTKMFEECRSGQPEELIAHYTAHPPGRDRAADRPSRGEAGDYGGCRNHAARIAACQGQSGRRRRGQSTGLDRKELYALAMRLK